MAKRRVETGATGEATRANVARIRKSQGLTLQNISERLASTDRPMGPNTISEIERGARRVDVDDLVALSAALGVSPIVLLMPHIARGESTEKRIAATGLSEQPAIRYWEWLRAETPIRGEEFPQFLSALPWWLTNEVHNSIPRANVKVERGNRIERHGADDGNR